MLIKFKMGCFLRRKECTKYGRQAETQGESEGEIRPARLKAKRGGLFTRLVTPKRHRRGGGA